MTLIPVGCDETGLIYPGGAGWINECTIEVLDVFNTNEVRVKVYPMYESAITLNMTQGQTYNFIDFVLPFQVTPIDIFYSGVSNVKAAKFKLCALEEVAAPTLTIDKVYPELSPAADVPAYNRYGVYFEVRISGTGKGDLKLSWGNDHDEIIRDLRAGNYAYIYNLPPGEHNICADLFNVVV